MNTEQFEGHTPGPWEVKLCWTDAYMVVDSHEVICSLTGNKDSENRKEWAELIAAAPDLLAEVKRLRKTIERAVRHLHPEDFNVASASESNGFLLEKMWAATCALEGKEDW
jgi:hypothetical protein